MNITELISRLKQNEIEVSLNGQELKVDFWGDSLSDDLISEIRNNKPAIISFLRRASDERMRIPKVEEMESYPVSPPQYRSWIMSQLQDNHVSYNMPLSFAFGGRLDITALEFTVEKIQERHDSLRTCFREDANGEVRQYITPPGQNAVKIIHVDLRGVANQEDVLRTMVRNEIVKPFSLENGPLVRFHLYQVRDYNWVFSLTLHHIIGDSWSMGVLLQELMGIFYERAHGLPYSLQPLRIQYKDYACWMKSNITEEILKVDRTYWEKQLGGELPALEMPYDRPRPPVKTYNGGMTVRKDFDPAIFSKFRAVTKECGGTSFMGVLSCLYTLFYRYTGQEDIIIGIPMAGREHPDLLSQIGFYVNSLAIRTRFSGNDSYRQLLQQVKQSALEAYEHRLYPFDDMVDSMNIQWDKSRGAVFDIFLVMQPNEENDKAVTAMSEEDVTVNQYVPGANNPLCPHEMAPNFKETPDGLMLVFEYNSDLYNRSTILRLINHMERLMIAIASNPDLPLNQLDFLTAVEKRQLVTGFNIPATGPAISGNFAALVEMQAQATPDATALVYGKDAYTYKELNRMTCQLAAYLQRHYQVTPGEHFIIKGGRNPWVIMAMLASVKLGVIYTLLDAAAPPDVNDPIVNDIAAVAVIDDEMVHNFFREESAYSGVELPPVHIASGIINVVYKGQDGYITQKTEMTPTDWVQFFHKADKAAGDPGGTFTSFENNNLDMATGEILWALTNGLEVIIAGGEAAVSVAAGEKQLNNIDFSIFFFGTDGQQFDNYKMLLDATRFADENGFVAVWTPERHFSPFGAPYPSPAVMGAALGAITKNVHIRAGSVVVPLHNPLRIAEDWAVIDNLTGGRCGFASASGWHHHDFAFFPERFLERHHHTYENLSVFEALWRGESISLPNGMGEMHEYRTYPRPVQKKLPIWITSGHITSYIKAGELGYGVLTNLLHTGLDDLVAKIDAYKKAWREAGHPPGEERMVLMLHSYMEETLEGTVKTVKEPFMDYLRVSLGLVSETAQNAGTKHGVQQASQQEVDEMLEYYFERYLHHASLVGTHDACMKILERCSEIGVTEVACLVDFGVPYDAAMKSMVLLKKLMDDYQSKTTTKKGAAGMQAQLRKATEAFFNYMAVTANNRFEYEALPPIHLNGHAPKPAATTILELFSAQVNERPDAPALLFGDSLATYREVDEASSQLAHYLMQQHNVQPGDLVALLLNRSYWLPIAILGVLKTGGAYLPIEAGFPQDRIDFIISDSNCKTQLTEAVLDHFKATSGQYDKTLPAVTVKPSHLAYVMYTSGSTGKPKGVMLEHSSVAAFFNNMQPVFMMRPGMIFGASTSYTFDISVLELLGPLTQGMQVYVMANTDPGPMVTLLREGKINVLQITPSRLNQILELTGDAAVFSHLDVLLIGGEAMTRNQYDMLREMSGTQVFNVYGPTETTIWSTCLHLQQSNGLCIGRPLISEAVYILNSAGQLAPPCAPGEICIGGTGLARGYLNRPELNAEKFVDNPFAPGERMYRTGDLGRWLPDGTIEFYGRIDNQVKVRGYRIELGEIENVLQSCPGVDAAVVTVYNTGGGEKDMAAYIAGSRQLNVQELRTFLAKSLPAYMIPGQFIQLPALPLNQSGKVDRKQLPDPEGVAMASGVEYLPPRNETEEKLVKIWQSILGRLKIGMLDNFFELGGHSLRATRLVTQIHKEFNVKATLRDVFTYVILEDQARFISKAGAAVFHAIDPAPAMDGYPLSPGQNRLWILGQFEEANRAYNMPGVNTFEGAMNHDALNRAYRLLIARHESLRTVFRQNDQGEVKQYILDANDTAFDIKYTDLRQTTGAEEALHNHIQEALVRPFNLAKGPLLACELYQFADDKYAIVYVMHHIISDAWSMEILISELLQAYNAYCDNKEPALPPLAIQYKDYAYWQRRRMDDAAMEQQKQYWTEVFSGEIPVLQLPADHARPAMKTYNGGVVYHKINARITNSLKSVCQQQGCTLFMGLMAAVNTLFYRYTGMEDIVLGTTIAGREHANLQNQIGFYVNTLALRTRFSGTNSFRQILSEVRNVTLGAYEHQEYPFDELVNLLEFNRDMSRSPLADVMVVLHNTGDVAESKPAVMNNLAVGGAGSDAAIAKYDYSLNFVEAGDEILLRVEYNSDIYNRQTAERLGAHLEQLLLSAGRMPDAAIALLSYIPEQEQSRLLYQFNNTELSYPSGKTIPELFEEQALKNPGKTALIFENSSLTYAELHQQSAVLAAHIQSEYQLTPDDKVGIMLDRSDKMMIAVLAVLRAGAAYVPLEAGYPENRKAHMLEDTAVKLLITQTEYIFDLHFYTGPVYAIDVQEPAAETQPAALPGQLNARSLAYIMYTSGSTGTPKGVMVEHRSVVRLVKNNQFLPLTGDEVVLSTGALSFDATTFEFWSVLLNGGTLVLCHRDTLLSTTAMAELIKTAGVNTMWMTTGWLNQVIDADIELFGSLKTIITGGERISPEHVGKLITAWPHLRLINAYGPTENTTFSLTYPVNEVSNHIPIGKPISNSTVYILDDKMQLVATGVQGEICVGGDGLARGYLHNTELTAAKFVINPFVPGARLYKTGDLGRWLPDGNVEFSGRKDDQVKIRGFRVELGEIESVLQNYPGVMSAAVLVHETASGEKELTACLVTDDDVDIQGLNTFLSLTLPEYMMPVRYVNVEELPLNSNGKVDRKLLASMGNAYLSHSQEYIAPRNETEEKLALIWQEVLSRDRIGIKDNFFEIGGHSLRATRLALSIKKELGVDMSLTVIFTNPTIEQMAEIISNELWLRNGGLQQGEEGADEMESVEI